MELYVLRNIQIFLFFRALAQNILPKGDSNAYTSIIIFLLFIQFKKRSSFQNLMQLIVDFLKSMLIIKNYLCSKRKSYYESLWRPMFSNSM